MGTVATGWPSAQTVIDLTVIRATLPPGPLKERYDEWIQTLGATVLDRVASRRALRVRATNGVAIFAVVCGAWVLMKLIQDVFGQIVLGIIGAVFLSILWLVLNREWARRYLPGRAQTWVERWTKVEHADHVSAAVPMQPPSDPPAA